MQTSGPQCGLLKVGLGFVEEPTVVSSSPERTVTLLLPFPGKQSSMDEYGNFMAEDVFKVCVREE